MDNICKDYKKQFSNLYDNLEKIAYDLCIPLHGTFELTPFCNFRCKMCYIRLTEEQAKKQGRMLTNEEWLSIAKQAKDAGLLYLTLTGGEIFTRLDFRELYEQLSDMGILLQLLSNGYLIDENVIEWLSERQPYFIRITLYGSTNEVYERVCGIKNGFDKVNHAIDLIKAAGIPLFLETTVIDENDVDLPAMYKYAESKGLMLNHNYGILKPVRGANSKAVKHRLDHIQIFKRNLVNPEQLKFYAVPYDKPFECCNSYRKGFWVTWNGNLQGCAFINSISEQVSNDFLSSWTSLQAQLEGVHTPRRCISCRYGEFCQKCPGILESECGKLDETNDVFCDNAKRRYLLFQSLEEGE